MRCLRPAAPSPWPPAGPNTAAPAMVAEELEAELRRGGSVFRVDAGAVARHLGPGAAQRGPGDPGRAELTGRLHAVERGHDHVVYQTDADDSAWSRLCLSQADTVLPAASAETILRAAPWKPGPWQPARCAVSSSCCTRTGPRPRPGAWRDGRWPTTTTCATAGRAMWHGWPG